MGARATGSSGALPEPDINVTPLVDVVLVLLIIFMVIAPELEHGQRVELPVVENPDPETKAKLDPITVTVTAAGSWFVERDPVETLDALRDRLTRERAIDPGRRLVLKGDGQVRYADMRRAFALCETLGFSGISLGVSDKGRAGRRPGDG
jgi:biopolymer transport protein ExbD/biopolymer transport protein TolR